MVALLVVGCGYTDFDDIEEGSEPERWEVNSSIKDAIVPTDIPVAGDVIAEGVVVSSDSSGNFYKEILLADVSGYPGAVIRFTFNFYDLYTMYPVGSLMAFNLCGMVVSRCDGVLTAGYKVENDSVPAPIPSLGVAHKVLNVQQTDKVAIPCRKIKIDELDKSLVGSVVEIENCYFTSQLGSMKGEREIAQTVSENTAVISTSRYCSFADSPVLEGFFALRAIVAFESQKLCLKLNNYSDMTTKNNK